MRVASTMLANDASEAVCGASERSMENGGCSVRKETEKKRRKTKSRQVKHEDHVVKVNDKLNANATESKRTLGSFSANKFEATRERDRD